MTSSALPANVASAVRFLQSQGIWHLVTTNPPVSSCAEAATHRKRLGNIGIPLCDELKSSAGAFIDRQPAQLAIVHCRGHQLLDYEKIARRFGGRFERLSGSDLERLLSMEYGTVSPVMSVTQPDVIQIVDRTVLEDFYPPYTMMTNLGDRRHAVELHPKDLFDGLPNVIYADVVRDADRKVPSKQAIGILTGNSPESGMLLWQILNEEIRRNPRVRIRGDFDFPRVVIESVPEMGLSMELERRQSAVQPIVLAGVERLCSIGVNAVTIACNTTQFYAQEVQKICASFGVEYISLVDTAALYLRGTGVDSFDFLSIGPVADLEHWSDFGRLKDEFSINVPSQQAIRAITELAFSVKREVVSAPTINRLRDLIASGTENDTVVLAVTELSILFASQRGRSRSGKKFIDTLQLLGKEIARRYCDERASVGAG